jgi:hypothetical protein
MFVGVRLCQNECVCVCVCLCVCVCVCVCLCSARESKHVHVFVRVCLCTRFADSLVALSHGYACAFSLRDIHFLKFTLFFLCPHLCLSLSAAPLYNVLPIHFFSLRPLPRLFLRSTDKVRQMYITHGSQPRTPEDIEFQKKNDKYIPVMHPVAITTLPDKTLLCLDGSYCCLWKYDPINEDGHIIAGTPGIKGCQDGRGKQIRFTGTGRLLVLDMTHARESVEEANEPFEPKRKVHFFSLTFHICICLETVVRIAMTPTEHNGVLQTVPSSCTCAHPPRAPTRTRLINVFTPPSNPRPRNVRTIGTTGSV